MKISVSKYTGVKLQLLLMLFIKGKLSIRKVFNVFICYAAYYLSIYRSGKTPVLMNFELSNHCNENCVFCRDEKGKIYNQNPTDLKEVKFVDKGRMELDIFKGIIDEVKNTLLVAIPYVNGEPFIYSKLSEVLGHAKKNKVGTLISSNGILLNEKNVNVILEQDLDFIKIHVSGFTDPIHQVQHRKGSVEVIKQNLINLRKEIDKRKSKIVVLVDYIKYKHNVHELEQFREFAKELNFNFSVRPGNPFGLEHMEDAQPVKVQDASEIPCEWLWTALTVNWNGDLLPCCDYVVWTGQAGYGNYKDEKGKIKSLWNGDILRGMRETHATKGRKPIPICADCKRIGTDFKF